MIINRPWDTLLGDSSLGYDYEYLNDLFSVQEFVTKLLLVNTFKADCFSNATETYLPPHFSFDFSAKWNSFSNF